MKETTVASIFIAIAVLFALTVANLFYLRDLEKTVKNGTPLLSVPYYASIDYNDGFFVVDDGTHITVYESKK